MKIKKQSVTVVIPAYNEEKNLPHAVESVLKAAKTAKIEVNILIVNDGSIDRTRKVADLIARDNRHKIRVIHNANNMGLGSAFRIAITHVKSEFLTVFPGDNDMDYQSLIVLFQNMHKADLVNSYMVGKHNRSLKRRIISKFYVIILNWLFRLKLRYFNGPFICRTKFITNIPLTSTGMDIFAEAKIRMLKKGCSYHDVPFIHTGRKTGTSAALKPISIIRTLRNTLQLLIEL